MWQRRDTGTAGGGVTGARSSLPPSCLDPITLKLERSVGCRHGEERTRVY